MGQYKFEDLKRAVLKEVEVREKGAAMRGAMSDDGASRLREQVKWYEMGKNLEYPVEWEQFKKHIDDEYEEYLRLKKKFE